MSAKPKKLRHRLTELILQEVSLVDRPANPRATVVLFKRDSSKETDMTEAEAKKLAEDVAKAGDLAKAQATEIEFLKGNLEKQTTSLAALTTERDELAGKVKDLTKTEPKPIEIPKEAQAQIDEALAKVATAHEELAKMRDTSDTAIYVAKAAAFKALPQKPDEFGPVLLRVARNKATPEDVIAIETLLKGANSIIEEGGIFKQVGSDQGGSSVATDRIDVLAKEIAKSDKVTYETAYAKVLELHPELYKQYVDENMAH